VQIVHAGHQHHHIDQRYAGQQHQPRLRPVQQVTRRHPGGEQHPEADLTPNDHSEQHGIHLPLFGTIVFSPLTVARLC
jgi:hypothetical protein